MKPALNLLDETARDVSDDNCHHMNSTLSMILQPTSFDSGQLKAMAMNIINSHASGCPGVIMVANAVSEKDKGLVAVNLAVSISENSDKHVFLIDCDTKSPSVHKFFKYENKAGLMEYLSCETPLSSLILKTKIDKLRVLTCGNTQNHSQSLFQSDKMSRFIRELKEKCPDLVMVINTDSSQLSGRSHLEQDLVDGFILSVDESVAGSETTKSIFNKLGKKKLLGVIKKRTTIEMLPKKEPESHPQFDKTLRLVLTPKQKDLNPSEIKTPAESNQELSVERPENETPLKDRVQAKKIKKQKEVKPVGQHNNFVSGIHTDSFESEQFKMLTAHLMNSDTANQPQVLMVTSSSPGEGKSFIASNFATSLAQNTKKKVLLIDCDMRSPSIHKIFGCENVSGLGDYLSQNISFSSQCQASGLENLTLLPAGNSENDSFRLLSSEKMEKLITGLKKKFKDLIIILDSAPPTLIAESGLLAKLADGIALVVNHNQTKREEMKKLVEMFDKEKIVGVIYNQFKPKRSLLNRYKHYCKRFITG